MLRSLSIENIAVIEKCNIDFSNGFNCLTGETGAGKSIVIDAINAVTGQRTSKDLIRTGCEKATVTAVFDDVDNKTCNLLSEYGISIPEAPRALTESGKIIEIQGTAEENPFDRKQLNELLDLAECGLKKIFAIQREALESI